MFEVQRPLEGVRFAAFDDVAGNEVVFTVVRRFLADDGEGRLVVEGGRFLDHFRSVVAARVAVGEYGGLEEGAECVGRVAEFLLDEFGIRRGALGEFFPHTRVQVLGGVAAYGGAVGHHFADHVVRHGVAVSGDEVGVDEDGEGKSHFTEDRVGIRVGALPAVVDGDEDAFCREFLLPVFQSRKSSMEMTVMPAFRICSICWRKTEVRMRMSVTGLVWLKLW